MHVTFSLDKFILAVNFNPQVNFSLVLTFALRICFILMHVVTGLIRITQGVFYHMHICISFLCLPFQMCSYCHADDDKNTMKHICIIAAMVAGVKSISTGNTQWHTFFLSRSCMCTAIFMNPCLVKRNPEQTTKTMTFMAFISISLLVLTICVLVVIIPDRCQAQLLYNEWEENAFFDCCHDNLWIHLMHGKVMNYCYTPCYDVVVLGS